MKLQFKYYQLDNLIWSFPGANPGAQEDEQPDDGWDGFIEAPTREDMLNLLSSYVERVWEHAIFVSGDDEYFDYYPDNFYVLEQLAEQVEYDYLDKMIERARQWAVETRYANMEPEALGGDTEKYVSKRDPDLIEAADRIREARRRIIWGVNGL